MTLKEFVTILGFEVDEKGLKAYDDAIGRVYQKTDNLTKNLHKVAEGLVRVGNRLSLYLSAPIAGLATVSVMAQTKLQDLQNEWGVLLNDMELGKKMVSGMYALAEKTPFNPEQIDAYSKALRRMRVPFDQILPRIKMYADISARTGVSMEDLVDLQESVNRGFVNPRLLKSLVGRGIIDRNQLSKIFGSSDVRVLARMANIPGRITPTQIMQLINTLGAQSMGAAERRTFTLKKGFESLWTSVFRLRAAIGDMIAKNTGLADILKKVTGFVNHLTDRVERMSPGTKKFLVIIGGIAFALGPIIAGSGKLILLMEKLALISIGLKGAGGLAGIAKIAGGIGGSLLKILGPASLIIGALLVIYALFQDIWMYLKYGKQASLFGSIFEDVGAKLHQTVDSIVNWFMGAWQKVRDWWDLLWKDPWRALMEIVMPEWLRHLIEWATGTLQTSATPSVQYATVPGMFTPAVSSSTGININMNVTTPTVEGTSTHDRAKIQKMAEDVFGLTAKRITDSIHNQIKPSGG